MARTSNPEQVQRWHQLIDLQTLSGLSIPEFCQANDVFVHRFYFWRRKLANRNPTVDSTRPSGLVPVRIVANSPSSNLCIRFTSGATIEAPATILRDAIEQILATEHSLRGSPSC